MMHGPAPSVDPKGLELAVEGRALHPDELRRTRNIAAEPTDLCDQIFALEHLACVSQRQTHEMLTAVAARHGGHHGADVLREHVGIDHGLRVDSGEGHQSFNVVAQLATVESHTMGYETGQSV